MAFLGKAIQEAGGGQVQQAVLLVTGILGKAAKALGVTEEADAADASDPDQAARKASTQPGLGGFISDFLKDPQAFLEGLQLSDAENLPLQVWEQYKGELLGLILPKVAEFVLKTIAKFSPTVGAAVAWAKTAWDVFKAVRERLKMLADTFKEVASITHALIKAAPGSKDLQSLGGRVSKLFQDQLPVVFDLLAAAFGVKDIKDQPQKAVEALKGKVEKPLVKFLAGLAKPVVKRLGGAFKGRGLDGLTLLTRPVKLKKAPKRMGVLAKE